MVAKGVKVRLGKNAKLEDRKERSICVRLLHSQKKVEKPLLEEIIKGLHQGIESVFFPRQKYPKFCFVLCLDEENKKEAWDCIKKFKNDDVGKLIPRSSKSQANERKTKTEEDIAKKTSKGPDLLTLVLEAIPKDLSTEEIKANFPKCTSIIRFSPRRCYLKFATIPDTFFALKKIRTEPICGFQISVRYNRIPKKKKSAENNVTETSAENASESTEQNISAISGSDNSGVFETASEGEESDSMEDAEQADSEDEESS